MIKYLCTLLLLIFFHCQVMAQNLTPVIDSLSRKLQAHTADDTVRLKLLLSLAGSHATGDVGKMLSYAGQADTLARQLQRPAQIAHSLFLKGVAYRRLGDAPKSIDHFLQALKMHEQHGHKKGIGQTMRELGNTYTMERRFDLAIKYLEQNVALQRELNTNTGLAVGLNDLAVAYLAVNRDDDALKALEETLAIARVHPYSDLEAVALGVVASIHTKRGNYAEALKMHQQGIELTRKSQSFYFLTAGLIQLGSFYHETSKYPLAIRQYREAIDIATPRNYLSELRDAYQGIAESYAKNGDYRQAFEAHKLYSKYRDSISNEESLKKTSAMQAAYEAEKHQAKLDLVTKENQIDKLVRNGFGGGLVLVFVLAFVLFRSNRRRKRDNELLLMQNEEINQQKEEIITQAEHLKAANEEIIAQRDALETQHNEIVRKNQDIESSIRYAKRIQTALLPYPQTISRVLPEHFILYKPREIVSGDFYWFHTLKDVEGRDEKIILAAVDCTGHGVPGAFMSMLGDSLLTQIVIDRGITDPSLILKEMHRGIRKILKQDETDNRDGMDMALCTIDLKNKQLEYSGAKNPLYLVEHREEAVFRHVKADKSPIGGRQIENERNFTRYSFELSVPTTFYIFTDGYQDQFGGEHNQKFMSKRFRELLTQLHQQPMEVQKNKLETTFEQWKHHHQQVDDVLVIGVRINP